MAREILTVQVDSELRQAFARAVRMQGDTEAEVLGDLMRDYVQRARQATEHDAQVGRKAAQDRAAANPGDVVADDHARMAELRAELMRRAAEADRRARRR